MRTATYDEILRFLRIDGWVPVRTTGHVHYEKRLPSGETLRTHASWSGQKTMSPGRFHAILHDQLRVGADEFWEALRTRKPPGRPSPSVPPAPTGLPLWLSRALVAEAGFTEHELVGLTEGEAAQTLDTHRKQHPRQTTPRRDVRPKRPRR